MNQRLFVYGTLKKGQYFHEKYLAQAHFLGVGFTSPDYSLYVGAQPHLIRELSDRPVKGELYLVSNDVLHAVDGLEGHPVVYRRELVECLSEDGTPTMAWAYLRHKNFSDRASCEKEYEYT